MCSSDLALRRHYIYKIKDGNGFIEPTARLDIAPWYRDLNIDLMNQAAATLIGEHDFFSYARFRENATTIRDLQRFDFVCDELNGLTLVCFLEHEPEELGSVDAYGLKNEPDTPESWSLFYAYLPDGLDISGVLHSDIVNEIEQQAADMYALGRADRDYDVFED